MQMTLQELSPQSFQKLTATASDFHARLSALLEIDEASKILEELCFLKSCGWLKSESLVYFSPKTLKDFLTTRGGEHSESSSAPWTSWGMMSNGKCLTAQILESHKTGKECLLSDILEDEVNEKYFLSETAQKRLMSYRDSTLEQLQQEQGNRKGSERMLLKVNSLHKTNNWRKSGNRVYDPKGLSVTIKEATAKGYAEAHKGDSINLAVPGSKTRRGRVGKGIANTLDTSCAQGVLDGYRIRKLTPRECFRLQGFPDDYFDCAAAVSSDSQLYKQAGNSVTVNVIYEIARRLT